MPYIGYKQPMEVLVAWGLHLIGYRQPLKGGGGGGGGAYFYTKICTNRVKYAIYSHRDRNLHLSRITSKTDRSPAKTACFQDTRSTLPSPPPPTHTHTRVLLLPTNVECNTFDCGWFLSKPESCHLKQERGATERMISSWRHICDTHIQVREHFNTRELRKGYPL